MFTRSPNVSKSLIAGVTAMFLIALAPSAEAAWFSWGKAPPAPATSEAPVVMAQADADRFNSLEAQMRNLTGQIEELTFQLKTAQDQLKRLQEDSDFRFRELEGGKAAAKGAPAVNEPPAAQAATKLPPAEQPPAADALPAESAVALGEPPKPLGTVTLDAPPSAEPPLDLSTLANGNGGAAAPPAAGDGVAVASIAPTGHARADYDQAYKLINAGRYDLAEQAFRQFLTAYPKDELAPDAQYWLGESLYNHGDYASAAEEFKNGYTKYPKAKRAPDTLLKLGLSLAGLGFRDDACKMYAAALSKYPQMSNGLRQRVKAEQASAAC
jgi:tol-pal system protein YbgF